MPFSRCKSYTKPKAIYGAGFLNPQDCADCDRKFLAHSAQRCRQRGCHLPYSLLFSRFCLGWRFGNAATAPCGKDALNVFPRRFMVEKCSSFQRELSAIGEELGFHVSSVAKGSTTCQVHSQIALPFPWFRAYCSSVVYCASNLNKRLQTALPRERV